MAESEFRIQQDTAAIASGDTDAFARFYHAYVDRMYAEARRTTKCDEALCLDIVQDAMVRVIHRIGEFTSETELWAWLRVLIRCTAIDRIRSEQRRSEREQRRSTAVQEQDRESADHLAEQLRWLRSELGEMDAKGARLLVMRYKLGWTLEQIGRNTGLSPSAVDGRLRRLVGGLRDRARKVFADG